MAGNSGENVDTGIIVNRRIIPSKRGVGLSRKLKPENRIYRPPPIERRAAALTGKLPVKESQSQQKLSDQQRIPTLITTRINESSGTKIIQKRLSLPSKRAKNIDDSSHFSLRSDSTRLNLSDNSDLMTQNLSPLTLPFDNVTKPFSVKSRLSIKDRLDLGSKNFSTNIHPRDLKSRLSFGKDSSTLTNNNTHNDRSSDDIGVKNRLNLALENSIDRPLSSFIANKPSSSGIVPPLTSADNKSNVSSIKVKSLAEIRAEKSNTSVKLSASSKLGSNLAPSKPEKRSISPPRFSAEKRLDSSENTKKIRKNIKPIVFDIHDAKTNNGIHSKQSVSAPNAMISRKLNLNSIKSPSGNYSKQLSSFASTPMLSEQSSFVNSPITSVKDRLSLPSSSNSNSNNNSSVNYSRTDSSLTDEELLLFGNDDIDSVVFEDDIDEQELLMF